jgi:adenine-specific DNA methylase
MAGYLSRWDRWYLKSYEAMAGHRFNLTTLAAEPNVWGTAASGRGTLRRRLRLLGRAADWLRASPRARARVTRGSSESLPLPERSIDLVLTDPPYHDDVQYAELSLPLRAWAGLPTEVDRAEAVAAVGRPRDDYRRLMTGVLTEARRVLRGDGRLVFSYANRDPEAWADLFEALQEAGFSPVACAAVHSENERDQVKRGIRSCTLDLLLELAPEQGPTQVAVLLPGEGPEAGFLERVAAWFERIGALEDGWRAELSRELRSSAFLG